MRIRALFNSSIIVAVVLVAGLIVAGGIITAEREDVAQVQERAQATAREVADLLVLTHEYALYSETRAVQQWRERQAAIVGRLEAGTHDSIPVAAEVLVQAKGLSENFQRLVELGLNPRDPRSAQATLLFSQLLTSAHLLDDSVQQWASAAGVQRELADRRFLFVATAIPVALLLILIALSVLLYRRILHPLARLHGAVQAVARGDLSGRGTTAAADEFGDLSRTFDAMAVDLVKQLRGEVSNRAEAERALAKANNELATREALLAQILDTSSVAIFLVDGDGRLIHANQCMAEMFAVPLPELIGKDYVELIQPSEREVGRQKMLSLLANNVQSVDLERRYWRADQSEFWGHLTGRKFIDGQGEQRGLVGVIADITERKLAEVKLLNIKAIVDSTDDAVISKTLAGIIMSWNRGAERIFGYAADAAIGNPLRILIPDDRVNEEQEIQALISRGQRLEHFETVRRHKDGRLIDVSVTLSPIENEAGEVIGASEIARDITESKLAQAELTQYREHLEKLVDERTIALSVAKEAAETANRAKSAFLANMSHELRTPMNAIMGMTDLARRRASDAAQMAQLTKVSNASRQLLGIINDILDFSRIEAEQLSLEQIDLRLADVLDHLLSLTEQNAQEKGLTLAVEMAPDLADHPLLGDPSRLGQILHNLTTNAIKFTTAGSVVVRVVVKEESPADVLVRFEVHDTGIGIADEDRKRLFAPFVQADGSSTRKHGGAGLGLAICKRLAETMGGNIGVDSRVGAGSCFWFTARLGKPPAAAMPPLLAEGRLKAYCAGLRVLLADDESVSQEITKWLLEDTGLRVDVADDGEQAVALAGQNAYALILIDMRMSKLSGLDAARAIRTQPPNADTPLVAMSIRTGDEDRRICLDAGMNDLIAKPIDPQQLYDTVCAWLERNGRTAPDTRVRQ